MQQRSEVNREDFFAFNQFDGIIYGCTKYAQIESIYSPQFGKIAIESDTDSIENRIRPIEGRLCKFSAYYKDGRWYAKKITIMPSPPLTIERKAERCVMKGIAVVCGVYEEVGWLWSDILGRILLKKELVKDLKPFTCVHFNAVKCSTEEPSVAYEAESIMVEEDTVFQSSILHFKRSVTVEENGIARIDEERHVLMVDDSCTERPFLRGAQLLPTGSEASILYFEHYGGSTDELVSVLITQNDELVEGISDGALCTKRHYIRVQQVYRIEELLKEDEDRSLIFQFTEEEDSQQRSAIITTNGNGNADLEMATENMQSEHQAGAIERIGEPQSSWGIGWLKNEVTTAYGIIRGKLNDSLKKKHLTSVDEQVEEAIECSYMEEKPTNKWKSEVVHLQTITSADDENSANENKPDLEEEYIDPTEPSLSSNGAAGGERPIQKSIDGRMSEDEAQKNHDTQPPKGSSLDIRNSPATAVTKLLEKLESEDAEQVEETRLSCFEDMAAGLSTVAAADLAEKFESLNVEEPEQSAIDIGISSTVGLIVNGNSVAMNCEQEVSEEQEQFPYKLEHRRDDVEAEVTVGEENRMATSIERNRIGDVADDISEGTEGYTSTFEALDSGLHAEERKYHGDSDLMESSDGSSLDSDLFDDDFLREHRAKRRDRNSDSKSDSECFAECSGVVSEEQSTAAVQHEGRSSECDLDVGESYREEHRTEQQPCSAYEKGDTTEETVISAEYEERMGAMNCAKVDESHTKHFNERESHSEYSSNESNDITTSEPIETFADKRLMGECFLGNGRPYEGDNESGEESKHSEQKQKPIAKESKKAIECDMMDALRKALNEFFTELIISMNIGRHIISAPKGSYLMAAMSCYVSGDLISFDELFEYMHIEPKSSFYLNFSRCILEYDNDIVLGIVICELLCHCVPQFVTMAFGSCASMAAHSPHYEHLSRLFRSQLDEVNESRSLPSQPRCHPLRMPVGEEDEAVPATSSRDWTEAKENLDAQIAQLDSVLIGNLEAYKCDEKLAISKGKRQV